jgi:hypothetical protein
MKINMYIAKYTAALFLLLLVLGNMPVFAQEEGEQPAEEQPVKDRPSKPAFESGLLFDGQTGTIPTNGTLELVIQHRFGTVEQGITDLYGIWAPSNIRLGLNYSILNNLMVGIGTTKFKKMQDIQVKYTVLKQTRQNTIPVSVTLYGNLGIDGQNESMFGETYKFSNRFNYYGQIIITRRFNDMFSLQIAPSFTHYNMVDSIYDHDRIGISFAGRVKFSPQTSFVYGADIPLKLKGITEHAYDYFENGMTHPKPNYNVGFEISTSTHAFHIYLASAQGILAQENLMWNQYEFFKGGFLLGLSLTRLWTF